MRNHIKRLEFIEQISPEHYLFILCSSKEANDDTLIRHFAIFNLSRTGRWKLVENEIKKYIG